MQDFTNMFKDQYFIITGGNEGLGAEVSNLLACRGAKGIIICGVSKEKGEKQEQLLRDKGCDAYFVQADFTRFENCQLVIDAAEKRFNAIHGLVNCAGISNRGTIIDTTPDLFDQIFSINVKAPFFLMQYTIKLMLQKKIEGSIVNILSMNAHGGQSELAAYSSSKGALATLTKNVAFSAMRNRIRVNGINVGWMDTVTERKVQEKYHNVSEQEFEEESKKQPFGRLIKPQEIAKTVLFLLSKESGLMTGSLIDFEQGIIGCGDNGMPQPLKPLEL
ncbi:SDR family oxidoreductase [Commensalibacter oyaizuii]|uniref:SDR family oxidoreductase n=1 Tax=Commensalibacter oyaizuii TaxID=3043873 RepID=A0ABT6PZM8_9PROT|nr:SDR family oxidoreductase [Commensalibacter sp. TBRC 16381]MDI2090313.1 SDR family oxidoreductase [Commensalibacter sp. TBRC 16381]